MNEIKFRAWHKATRKMYQVTSLGFGNDGLMLTLVHVRGVFSIHPPQKAMPSELELIQYIGLKDKNGTEIWEGDIVRTRGGYSGIPVFFIEQIEDIHAFCGECGINGDNPKDVEIIGNIYDNPELAAQVGGQQ